MRKKFPFALILGTLLLLFMISPSLNPFNGGMFSFHDPTQVGRVTSFANSLKSLHIPPRFSPEFSLGMGFPIFNYYAPTAYWLTSSIVVLGVSSVHAVKFSFLVAILISFLGMYYLLKHFFEDAAAMLGASVYVTSTYFATEIIVRGNLAETWFLALLPVGLALIIRNSKTKSNLSPILTTLVLALLFTSHNMMMLFAVPIALVFLSFFPNQKRNLLAVFLALLIDSYFLLPAFLEGHFVQATKIAHEYPYQDHFLCPWQLWTALRWEFGGSLPGCETDTMSFKIGKIQVLLGIAGLLLFFAQIAKRKKVTKQQYPLIFIAIMCVGGFFLTLSQSQFIWDLFSSIMSLFQFPWRFIVFGLFGVAVFAGYFYHTLPIPFKKFVLINLMFVLFYPGQKYFVKPLSSIADYEQEFNSERFFINHLAYYIPEYLAHGANIDYWRSIEPDRTQDPLQIAEVVEPAAFEGSYQIVKNESYEQTVTPNNAGPMKLHIHYFPFWRIFVNGQRVIPTEFDDLARPIIPVNANDTVLIKYQQTLLEMFANFLTVVGFFLLFSQQRLMKVIAKSKQDS